MFDLSVIIGDSDERYLNKVSNYLSGSNNYHFSIQAFSNANSLNQYLNNNSTEILLVTEKLYKSIQKSSNANVIMLLIDSEIDPELLSFPKIFKYQKGQFIEKQLVGQYYKNYEKESINLSLKSCQIIAVTSPIGGSGKTTVAVGLSKIYAQKGYKTLFITLENISTVERESKDNLSDLIYHLKKKTKNINTKLEGLMKVCSETNLKYISPVFYPEHMEALLTEDLINLLNYLKKYGWYERIILDLPGYAYSRNKAIMSNCHKVLLIGSGDRYQMLKMTNLLSFLKNEEAVFHKLLIINNKVKLNESDECDDLSSYFCISNSKGIYSKEQLFNIDVNNSFGNQLKQLTEVINGEAT